LLIFTVSADASDGILKWGENFFMKTESAKQLASFTAD